MKLRCRLVSFALLPLLIILLAGEVRAGLIVSTFNPQDFFSATGAPTSAEVDALDAAAGTSNLIKENFEDTSLVPGLSSNVSISLKPHGDSPFFGAWDGEHALEHRMEQNGNDWVFSYTPGATTVAFGLSGVHHDQRLLVNAVDLGQISSLTNYEANVSGTNSRNIYVRVDREPGGNPITEFRIAAPTVQDDFVQIDHIAVQPVPEPSSLALLGTGLLSLLGGGWKRRRAVRRL